MFSSANIVIESLFCVTWIMSAQPSSILLSSKSVVVSLLSSVTATNEISVSPATMKSDA